MMDIANVINRDATTLKLTDLVGLIQGRPEEQAKLEEARKKLIAIGKDLKTVNDRNKELLDKLLQHIKQHKNLLDEEK